MVIESTLNYYNAVITIMLSIIGLEYIVADFYPTIIIVCRNVKFI